MTLHLPAPDLELDPAFWVRYWAAMARVGTDREGMTVRIARPTFLDVIAWLWRWLADTLVALLTHPTAGRHFGGHVGATPEYADELAAVRQALTDTVRLAPVAAPLVGWALEDTQKFTHVDRLDARGTDLALFTVAGEWPDGTEVAFTAAVRQAGGA